MGNKIGVDQRVRGKDPKISFLVVDARVEQKFRGIKGKSEKSVDRKINGHTDIL